MGDTEPRNLKALLGRQLYSYLVASLLPPRAPEVTLAFPPAKKRGHFGELLSLLADHLLMALAMVTNIQGIQISPSELPLAGLLPSPGKGNGGVAGPVTQRGAEKGGGCNLIIQKSPFGTRLSQIFGQQHLQSEAPTCTEAFREVEILAKSFFKRVFN